MSWRRRWVVLAPGEAAWLERRVHEIFEEHDDGREHHFMIIPGQRLYQSIVERGHQDIGQEILLGRLLSLECEEPVYAIQGIEEFPCISRFWRGQGVDVEDQEPGALVRSLGCSLPWLDEPPLKPRKKTARTVVLIQGLSAPRVLNALEKRAGQPLPAGAYRLEEVPQGLLLTDGTRGLGFADIDLSYRFPRATFHAVTATPDLAFFQVTLTQNRKTVQFVPPPKEATSHPPVHEIMGEREPARILAALGIPKEWFQL